MNGINPLWIFIALFVILLSMSLGVPQAVLSLLLTPVGNITVI